MATRTYTWTTSSNSTAGSKWGNYTIPTHSGTTDRTWLYGTSSSTITGTTKRILTITHVKLTAYVESSGYCKWYGHVVWNSGSNSLTGTYTNNSGSQSGTVTIINQDVSISGSYIDPSKLLGVCIQGSADSAGMGNSSEKRVVLTITFTEAYAIHRWNGSKWELVEIYYAYDDKTWHKAIPYYCYDNLSWHEATSTNL